jgi:hypothetical protein
MIFASNVFSAGGASESSRGFASLTPGSMDINKSPEGAMEKNVD